jgi:glyoxylase-like metal-dependent hydrolase (beta-lactamase superfamily II)
LARAAAVLIADGVWRIPTSIGDFVNSYAFRDRDGTFTLIDAGLSYRWANRKLRRGLAWIGAGPGNVSSVVATHAHSDHVGGLARIAAQTGAGVAAHEREAVYLRDGKVPRFSSGRTGKFRKVTVAEEFVDGTILPVAGGLRVVHTPGHSPGHVSLLHEPTGVLVTGDAIFNVRGLRYPFDSLCTDLAVNRASADALGDLDFEIAAFTHGPEIRHCARDAVRAFLRGRER